MFSTLLTVMVVTACAGWVSVGAPFEWVSYFHRDCVVLESDARLPTYAWEGEYGVVCGVLMIRYRLEGVNG